MWIYIYVYIYIYIYMRTVLPTGLSKKHTSHSPSNDLKITCRALSFLLERRMTGRPQTHNVDASTQGKQSLMLLFSPSDANPPRLHFTIGF